MLQCKVDPFDVQNRMALKIHDISSHFKSIQTSSEHALHLKDTALCLVWLCQNPATSGSGSPWFNPSLGIIWWLDLCSNGSFEFTHQFRKGLLDGASRNRLETSPSLSL